MTARRVAALFGLLGVALGAFGAHALKDRMSADGHEWWKTATLYHLVHAVAMLATGRGDNGPGQYGTVRGTVPRGRATSSTCWFAAGITLFSGSLYAMALTDARWLGAATPFGGIALLAGWLSLFRSKD